MIWFVLAVCIITMTGFVLGMANPPHTPRPPRARRVYMRAGQVEIEYQSVPTNALPYGRR